MKTKTLSLLVAVAMLILPGSVSTVSAQFYLINFLGTGAADHVDSVRINNITKETTLLMDGNDTLLLAGTIGVESGLRERQFQVRVIPNPAVAEAVVTFAVTATGKYYIELLNAGGQKVLETQRHLVPGYHSFRIGGLQTGTYFFRVHQHDALIATGNMIFVNAPGSNPYMHYHGSETTAKLPDEKKSDRNIVTMLYTHGDLLHFICYADYHAVVIPHVATQSTTFTAHFQPCIDGDGNHYPIVYIGTQAWMVRNLKTTSYSDGTPIPIETNNSAWVALTTGAYCWYDNNIGNKHSYGALYNWYATNPATNGGKNLCPEGWRVPSDDEWTIMTNHFGGTTGTGGKLKETGFIYWNPPNTGATNEAGFMSRGAGSRVWNGAFEFKHEYGYFWTATEWEHPFAWLRHTWRLSANVARGTINKLNGFSIRCIKDQ